MSVAIPFLKEELVSVVFNRTSCDPINCCGSYFTTEAPNGKTNHPYSTPRAIGISSYRRC